MANANLTDEEQIRQGIKRAEFVQKGILETAYVDKKKRKRKRKESNDPLLTR